MSWVPIKKLIKSSVSERGLNDSVSAAAAVEAANAFFARRFNDSAHRLVRAVSYSRGELTVACRSPVFGEEVRLLRDELVESLRSGRPAISVNRLIFSFADDMLYPSNT